MKPADYRGIIIAVVIIVAGAAVVAVLAKRSKYVKMKRGPGLEQGFVMFKRKPAKMGDDHIFWIPRVYLRNGLVDPNAEYEVYLRKVPKKEEHQY